MKLKTIINLILLILIMPTAGRAATITRSLVNDYQTDTIYLFITNDDAGPGISFVSDPVVFGGGAAGWSATLFDTNTLVMQGAPINPLSGQFDVAFWDNRNGNGNPSAFFDFSLEWAEYLGGSAVGQGSLYFTNGAITGADGNFTATIPTPIPASAWMLVSGITLLVGIRRYRKEG